MSCIYLGCSWVRSAMMLCMLLSIRGMRGGMRISATLLQTLRIPLYGRQIQKKILSYWLILIACLSGTCVEKNVFQFSDLYCNSNITSNRRTVHIRYNPSLHCVFMDEQCLSMVWLSKVTVFLTALNYLLIFHYSDGFITFCFLFCFQS